MKTNKVQQGVLENQITIFRYKQKDMEDLLYLNHDQIVKDTAIPLGKDLAGLNKPEESCDTEQIYCGVLSGSYNKLMMKAKTELQSDIEELHIISDKAEADNTLKQLEEDLIKKENELRLKKRELDKKDNFLVKKDERYGKIQWFLFFMILVDMLISGTALQAMGYPLIIAYLIGFSIGIGIYFMSERLPEIIDKGRTIWQKRAIAIASFLVLGVLFYVLGIFRTINFTSDSAISEGAKPIYFACLNMFFVIVVTLTSYFNRPTKKERALLDQWKLKKEEVDALESQVASIKNTIQQTRKTQAHSELSRKQLLLYAKDIQQLIQQLYEEAFKTFMSTNLIHRSDKKIPKFFSQDVPKLNAFYTDIKL